MMKKIKTNASKLKYGLLTCLMLTMPALAGNNCDPSDARIDPATGKLVVGEGCATGTSDVFNMVFDKANLVMAGLMGLGSILMVGLFAFKAFKLVQTSDDPKGRSQAISGLVFYFIGAALFGAAALFAGMGTNLFK